MENEKDMFDILNNVIYVVGFFSIFSFIDLYIIDMMERQFVNAKRNIELA